jgi:shikimate kinase
MRVDPPELSDARTGPESERAADRLRALAARLRVDRAIVLVGMPGSGKTTMGRRLSKVLGFNFLDADEEIQRCAGGLTVSEIFAQRGEAEFRRLERSVIARLIKTEPPHVLATGGGAFMNAETRDLLRERAVSIWMRAGFDLLLARVLRKRGSRPLLNEDPEGALTRLLGEREPIYAEADFTVDSRNGPPSHTIELMLEALSTRFGVEEARS